MVAEQCSVHRQSEQRDGGLYGEVQGVVQQCRELGERDRQVCRRWLDSRWEKCSKRVVSTSEAEELADSQNTRLLKAV